MDLGLKGKVALLTGASRGLGFATAKVLAQEGARLAINSRDEANLSRAGDQLAKLGAEVVTLPGDLTDPQTPENLVGATMAVLGSIDLLFTNAGGPPPAAFDELDDAAWAQAVDLSLMSHVRLIRAGAPLP